MIKDEPKLGPERPAYCADHPKEELKLICETCGGKTMCIECSIDHKAHNYTFLKGIMEKHREELSQALFGTQTRYVTPLK